MTPRVPLPRPLHVHQRQTGGGGAAGPRHQKAPPECHACRNQRHTSPPCLYWHKHQHSVKIMGGKTSRRNNHRWFERYTTQLCLQSYRQPMWKLFSYANQSVTTNYLCIVDRKSTSWDCFQNKDLTWTSTCHTLSQPCSLLAWCSLHLCGHLHFCFL